MPDQGTKGYGLIGFPLTHSFSKQFFTDKFAREVVRDCYYENFPLERIEELPGLIVEHPELIGLNVTIPYKEKVIPYLNVLDEDAKAIGAVNTIKIKRIRDNFSLHGFNTDAYGFQRALNPHLKSFHKKALILGTGGASKAVSFALLRMGIQVTFVSRNPRHFSHLSYNELSQNVMDSHLIIINTSPLGMYPDVKSAPDIPYQFVTNQHMLFDLIYNPPETIFLKNGRLKGAIVINGLEMLHLQAEKAWEIWNETEK